jgi:RNA-directed DNA polymerase
MKFSDIENLTMLSEFLCVGPQSLAGFLSNSDVSRFCRRMAIPKKNVRLGYRIVYKANSQSLKSLHKVLQKHLNMFYVAPDAVHGFVPERNIRTNALAHLQKKQILKLDIEDFFGSVKELDIARVFEKIGCKTVVASWLAKLTTIDGKLVQGFNTSPVLANMVFEDIDNRLSSFCQQHHCEFTRYADDITISSNIDLPSVNELELAIGSPQFRINKSKTRTMFRGEKQFVTGLTVFDSNYPRIPRLFKRRTRLQLYYLKKYGCRSYVMYETGISEHDAEHDREKAKIIAGRQQELAIKIKGWIDFVHSIEPSLASKYYDAYNSIKW